MGILDWPSPLFSNIAIFKQKPDLPNGIGSTRRITIPNREAEAVGLEDGDRVSVDMYDDTSSLSTTFTTTLNRKDPNLRFTMPLRQLDLGDREFSNNAFHQVVVRKTRLGRKVWTPSPDRLYDFAIFKGKAISESSPDTETGGSLMISVPESEQSSLGLTSRDKLDVSMSRIDQTDGVAEALRESVGSVNRSVFRVSLFASGRDQKFVAFSVPAKRRAIKNMEKGDIFQVAARKV